jgi:hypothetical protein
METETICYLIEYTGWCLPLWWDGDGFDKDASNAMRFPNIRKAKEYMDERIDLEEACITEHIFYN